MENKFENENLMDNGNEEVGEEIIDEVETEDADEVTKSKKKKEKSMGRELLEWVVAFVVAVVLALIIRTFFFTLVAVSGPSMDNTLQDGERLVVSRFNYTPEQGDIIVFNPDLHDDPFIKRVIATEGQTVDIDSRGVVYVDGKVYDEDYIIGDSKMDQNVPNYYVDFPITVPKDCVFVMGDNRPKSHDGRAIDVSSVKENPGEDDYYSFVHTEKGMMTEPLYYGCVHKDDIMGKAVFRFWPLGKFGGLK